MDQDADKVDPHSLFSGNHEMEICLEGETDFEKNFINCKKNPGHLDLIPVKDFTVDYLPPNYQHKDMVDLVTCLAALTVKLEVSCTSTQRPDFFAHFGCKYPGFGSKGRSLTRTGTGKINGVRKFTENDNKTCTCRLCKDSDTPSKVWAEVDVLTARHVVFDDSEARMTRCVGDFDEKDSQVFNLDGRVTVLADVKGDLSRVTCVSCDLNLINRLEKLVRQFVILCCNANVKYGSLKNVDKLVVIVSHPHGCPKRISVGQWTDKHDWWGLSRYTYTASTCPGSSGAYVYKLGCMGVYSHPHSGSCASVNYSGELWDSVNS
ncbi:uncharacterized protein LOC131954757 [Physella acuta]|uniref:uncharacterized protein LOC131954757 n=1 Tax=Physella acuta TaxID=109671 RepID=UPI0027DB730D|nr:uncharacterized protein LOC131954757 [Physella acuta]